MILAALHGSQLYCNPRKTHLFETKVDFLVHHISAHGIEADMKKTDHIVNWPQLSSTKEVQQFCRLVCYIAHFLPQITEHTHILTELTMQDCNTNFPLWMERHNQAFNAIKKAMVGHDCLTMIDHSLMPTDFCDY